MIETESPRGMVSPRLFPGSSLRAGDLLGARYRVELLVRGGRASARFLGQDTRTSAPISIEIVMGASEEADAVGVRFLSCARRVANLKSRHLARVLDAGVTADGHPYVVTEALYGETIAKALELRGSAPTSEAIDIAIDICDALADAHANGLLHGDLGTEAIQSAPEVKVVGIGTTHATLALRPSEELGIRAPEQLDPANAIDEKTDVWGVGVILYTMLAGAPPFASDSPSNQNVALALDEPPQLAGVPDALADVVDSCLAKNPVLRPHTMKRLAEELAPFASEPRAAAARIAEWEEIAPQSSPTLVAVVYDALRKEKEDAVLSDADSTAPRTALSREMLKREGAVDVSAPRLPVFVEAEPSTRAMMRSEPPPAVAMTVPPPRDLPTVVTRRKAKWKLGMHPMTLIGASACIIVASAIAAGVIRSAPETSTSTTTAAAVAPPPAPEPRESPPPAAAPIAPANTGTVIAASALPEAPQPSPPALPNPAAHGRAVRPACRSYEPRAPRPRSARW
jgi:serine/threonine-protein kinase